MSSTPPPNIARCTLNGFLNNYVVCLELLDDAVRQSREYDPAPQSVMDALKPGNAVFLGASSPRIRVLQEFDGPARGAVDSWYVPSLQEARRHNALAPIADALLAARRALDAVRLTVDRASNAFDPSYTVSRDAAYRAFFELEALRPLVLAADPSSDESPEEDAGEHPGQSTVALTPAVRKAWGSFERAITADPSLIEATDQQVFEWIVKNDTESGYVETEFENWRRYLTTARRTLGRSKYERRSGRTGGSIVNADQIEQRDRESESD